MSTEDEGSTLDPVELVADLETEVVPLDSSNPDVLFDNLDTLGEHIADATVIGMGEASHGTREFFEFKKQLFQFLVEEHGIRMLGLEANFATVLDINEYVLEGIGTPKDALSQDGIHESYLVETMLQLIEWIRTFNDDRDSRDRVRFHGIDIQHPSAAASRLKAFLERTDPELLTQVRTDLDQLVDQGLPELADDEELQAHLDARQAVVTTLEGALDRREETFIASTSREAYERARRFIWLIEQGRKQFEAILDGRAKRGVNIRIRDSAMAAQVSWLLRYEDCNRIVLWGHNAHLTRADFGGGTIRHKQGIPSLGKNLAALSDINYYSLGLTLGGGAVTAIYVPEEEYRAYEIGAPPTDSVPDVFNQVDCPIFFLDLTALSGDSPLGSWLDSHPQHFDIVGGYKDSPVNLVDSDFRSQFDGLVFMAETSPSQPLSERTS